MQKSKAELKEIFVSGAKPQAQDFHDWMDSYMHKEELAEAVELLERISIEGDLAWLVDSELNSSSTNPVQNKVVHDALHGKVGSINVTSIAIVDGRLVVTTNAGDTYAFEPVQPIEEIAVLLEDGSTLTAEDGSVIVF